MKRNKIRDFLPELPKEEMTMIKEYIRRDEMIERTMARAVLGLPKFNAGLEAAIEVAITIPAADVVEVVRCRDCVHYNAGFECLIEGYGILRPANYFCADGQREGGGQDE